MGYRVGQGVAGGDTVCPFKTTEMWSVGSVLSGVNISYISLECKWYILGFVAVWSVRNLGDFLCISFH